MSEPGKIIVEMTDWPAPFRTEEMREYVDWLCRITNTELETLTALSLTPQDRYYEIRRVLERHRWRVQPLLDAVIGYMAMTADPMAPVSPKENP